MRLNCYGFLLLFLACLGSVFSQTVVEKITGSWALQQRAAIPLQKQGFPPMPVDAQGGPGKVVQGVNLLTGQPILSVPLGGLNVRGVSYPIILTYTGATRAQALNSNAQTPTSWVGLGFNLSTPFVAVNHKGTVSRFDDVYYCNLGPYGGGQILPDSSTPVKFFLASNPYVKISYDTGSAGSSFPSQITRWVFTFPDGKKMLMGDTINAQRYVHSNGTLVKAPPFINSPLQKFIYRWDIRSLYDTIPGKTPRNKILFEYDTLHATVPQNQAYVRENYVKNIKWMEGSTEVERYEFVTVPKGSNEYVGYAPNEPQDDERLYETRKLDSLRCYKEGVLDHFFKFFLKAQRKSVLDSILVYFPDPKSGAARRDSGWKFSYYPDSSRYYQLQSVTYPDSKKDSLRYRVVNFASTQGDQDTSGFTMKNAQGSDIVLPSNNSNLLLWKVSSSCNDNFCYMVARDLDDTANAGDNGQKQKLYVEIKRNLGHYFDPTLVDNGDTVMARFEMSAATSITADLDFIPMGNYVLLVDLKSGAVKVYEYDGTKWLPKFPFATDPRFNNSTSSFGCPIKVFAAPDYFLVEKMNAQPELVVALRKSKGWTSINQDSTQCNIDNKGSYGESVRASGSGPCLLWSDTSLTVTATPHYFLVLHGHTGVFNAYSLNGDAGFVNITSQFPSTGISGMQPSNTYRMNWDFPPESVTPGGDFFFVISQNSDFADHHYISGFYFDGQALRSVLEFQIVADPYLTTSVYPAPGYFVKTEGHNNTIVFHQLTGMSDSLGFSNPGSSLTGVTLPAVPLIRTYPNAFTIENYATNLAVGLRPHSDITTDYANLYYQVDRVFANGYKDRSSNLNINGGSKLFNVTISPEDNLLTGTYAMNGSSVCNQSPDTGPCTIKYYSARMRTDTAALVKDTATNAREMIYDASWKPYKEFQRVMSDAGRLATLIVLDSSTHKIRYRHYQFDGKSFAAPDSFFVVDSVISTNGLGSSAGKDVVKYSFRYADTPPEITEFNSTLQMPQFEAGRVFQTGPGGALQGVKTYFNLDSRSKRLSGKSMFLAGTENYSSVETTTQDTSFSQKTTYDVYHSASWPAPLYVNRPKAVYSNRIDSTWGRMSDTTYFFNYCDTNGAPRFVLNQSKPEKVILSQSLFDSLGFPKRTMTYNLVSSPPDTNTLKTCCKDTAYSRLNAIAASKSVFSSYYPLEDSIWRAKDLSLSDDSLKVGKSPVFKLDTGWLPGSKITLRDTNNFFQVLESKIVKSKASGALGESYHSYFYEGLRSDPVASISNAKYTNCAILMGESGNAGLTGGALDHRGKWSSPGATFSSARFHSGRYSIKVVDNYGPTTNDTLKDVRTLGFGYRVSAWIYSDTGTPVLTVERRQANGTIQEIITGNPVSGSASAKRVWQRWEVNLSYNQVTNGSLFNGNNDYLRIWVGTGAPAGNNNKVIYVDDIVCIPTNASVSLATYDRFGNKSSQSGDNFLPVFYDVNFKGEVTAVRDYKGRIFSQAAAHRMGEN